MLLALLSSLAFTGLLVVAGWFVDVVIGGYADEWATRVAHQHDKDDVKPEIDRVAHTNEITQSTPVQDLVHEHQRESINARSI